MKIRPGVELGVMSDVGCQRERNEDCFAYWEPQGDPDFDKKGRLAVVADGMGGHEGGQQASQIAIETVCQTYEKSDGADPQSALLQGLQAAHLAILEYATGHIDLYGMGTTCTAVSVVGRKLYYAHVGDSRLYLMREGVLSRLTRDHSYVGRLVETGFLRPEEAESHPQRHVLTAALGVGLEPVADSPQSAVELHADDVLVLCTDGLWGVLPEKELQHIAGSMDPGEACRALVEAARSRGGPDNITVQVIRISANSAA